jgi:hypothetical protein
MCPQPLLLQILKQVHAYDHQDSNFLALCLVFLMQVLKQRLAVNQPYIYSAYLIL